MAVSPHLDQNSANEGDLRTQIQELEGRLADTEQNVKRLTYENQRAIEENESLRKLAGNWEKDNDNLREDNRVLRERVRRLESNTRDRKQTPASLDKDRNAELDRKGGCRAPSTSVSVELIEQPGRVNKREASPQRRGYRILENASEATAFSALPVSPFQGHTLSPSKRSHPPGILSSVEPPVKRQRLSVPHNQGFSAPRLFPSQVPSPPQSPASALSPHHVPVPDATTSSPLSSLSPSPPPSEVEKPTLTIKIKPVRAAGNPPAVQEPKPRTPSEAKTKDFKDDIKVKAEAIVLPPDTIRGYLDGVPTLSVSPPPTTPAVSRDFMRLAYGGSSATLIQKVQPNRDPSHTPAAASGNVRGVRNLLYPQTNMNPAVPRRPGEPGLLFATRPEFVPDASKNERTKGPFTLFGCEKQGGKVRWKYLGEYESECVGKVSGDEFAQQKDAVKSAWGAQVVKKKTGPYVRMRRRIALRKAGRDPDEDEKEGKKKEEGEEEKEETGNDGDTDGEELGEEYATGAPLPSITPEDVIQAFSQGQEGVNVIRLRCTRYDHTFSDDINARWPDYPEMVEEEKESSKTKATSSSKKGKKKAEKGGAVGQSHRKPGLRSTDAGGSSSSLISMEADGPQLPAVQCASNGGGDQRGAPGPRTSNSSPPSTAGMADLEQGVEAGYGSDSNDSMRSFYAD